VSAKAYADGEKVDVLDAQGFCVTSDLGYLLDDELVILGRQDEVFIIHGENKFPYDIESIIRWESSQQVSKVACFGVDKRIVVVLENRSDTRLDATEADRLRRHVTAATGLQVDELIEAGRGAIPVTTSGKIKREAVVEAYQADTLPRLATHTWAAGPPSAPSVTPRTPAELCE
jgi:acyl-CoA synthetase (AMP-forming)/AMP-acid ligase II